MLEQFLRGWGAGAESRALRSGRKCVPITTEGDRDTALAGEKDADAGTSFGASVREFLAWWRDSVRLDASRPGPILTVAPTGLLRNWLAEHDRHVADPGFGEIVEAHGPGLADLRTGEARGGE